MRSEAIDLPPVVAMCPRCKRVIQVKPDFKFQTHDSLPPCRMVCNGSGEPVSLESALYAAQEVLKLREELERTKSSLEEVKDRERHRK